MFDDGLATGTVLGKCGHRKQVHGEERARRDDLQRVCSAASSWQRYSAVTGPGQWWGRMWGLQASRFSSSLTHGHDGVSNTDRSETYEPEPDTGGHFPVGLKTIPEGELQIDVVLGFRVCSKPPLSHQFLPCTVTKSLKSTMAK